MITLLTPAFWQEAQNEMLIASKMLSNGTGKLTLSVDMKDGSPRGYQISLSYPSKRALTEHSE